MKRPAALSESHNRRFQTLKKQLLTACAIGDVSGGKLVARDLKNLLLPTGHHTKYYEMLLNLCEMLILKNEYGIANGYLERIVSTTKENTRLFQEASFLLAIGKMHSHDLDGAEKNLRASLHSTAIKDPNRRKEFLRRISKRFEEESLITSLGTGDASIDIDKVIAQVEKNFVSNISDDEIMGEIGRVVPQQALEFVKRMSDMANRQLTHHERKMLPPPPASKDIIRIGQTTFAALSRRLWLSICPPESKFQMALDAAQDPKTIVIGIVTELTSQGFGFPVTMALAGISTYLLKITINGYCTKFQPTPIMKHRYERAKNDKH